MKLQSGLYETDGYKCLGNLDNDNMDLRLMYCGYEDCAPGHRFGPNKRQAYVIHVIVKGRGKLENEDGLWEMHAGDAFVLRPHEEAWYEADHYDPWTYIWIGFQGMRAKECVVNAGFDNNNQVIHNIDATKLQGYVTEMMKSPDLSYSNSLRRCAYLQMFLAELLEQYSGNVPGIEKVENEHASNHVKQLMAYLAEHYADKIRISEIADEMDINRSYLSNSFRKMTGSSPSDYLMKLRMEKARSLLKKTNYPIGQIAGEVGYSDALAFSRQFKRYFGQNPRQFRLEPDKLEIAKGKKNPENVLL